MLLFNCFLQGRNWDLQSEEASKKQISWRRLTEIAASSASIYARNYPIQQNPGLPNQLGTKYGRPPPSMMGNPLCPRRRLEPKKIEASAPRSGMKLKRTNTPKISNEPKASPVLSRKIQTVMNDTETMHEELNNNSKPHMTFAKIQNVRNEKERIDFVNRYQAIYPDEDLEDRLRRGTVSSGAWSFTQALLQTSDSITVNSLHIAVEEGTGAIDLSLIAILFLSSFEEKQRYAQLYSQKYPGTSLQQDIMNNTDSNVQKLCLALLQNEHKEMEGDGSVQAKTDVKELIDASKSARADKIIEILTTNCRNQTSRFIGEFDQANTEKLSTFISNGIPKRNRFGDLFHLSLKLIISLVEDPIQSKADKLYHTIKDIGDLLKSKQANQGLDMCRRMQIVNRMFLVNKQEMEEVVTRIEGEENKNLQALIQNIQEADYRNMLVNFLIDNSW